MPWAHDRHCPAERFDSVGQADQTRAAGGMGATRTVVANPKAWATIVDNGVEPDDGGLRMLGTLVRASAYVQVELHPWGRGA